MTTDKKTPGTYWDLLRQAENFLDQGDFRSAERAYQLACAKREDSPGRVFLTEKISDGLGRFLQRKPSVDEGLAGRWAKKKNAFEVRFLAAGDKMVRQGVHLAGLRPEDDAQANQPILEQALYLVGRSRIFAEEPGSSVPLLKGLFRTAKRNSRPFAVDLIRHDLPLTEEDRLWLARRGGDLVIEFQEQGLMAAGSPEAEEWARVCLQLLNPCYFGTTGRLEEERSWVEAVTADHLLGRPGESVEAYRNYLAEYPTPGERADEARIRSLELLGNVNEMNFQVPRYEEALAAMQSAGLANNSAMAGRFQAALGRIEYRRPGPEPGQTWDSAWASLALENDGRVAVVFWWGEEPRDVAYWRPGEDLAGLLHFLEPCQDRLICDRGSTLTALQGQWNDWNSDWTVRDFCAALLEGNLPSTGLDPDALLRMGMGETAAWRTGWNPDHGHPHLEPPKRSMLAEAWLGGPAGSALAAGLLLLAIRTRLATADPCLRAGIRHLARRGDPASSLLYEFISVGQGTATALDSSFEPWTLPLLWTRPDPFGWSSQGPGKTETTFGGSEALARPDLGRNDLAIVSTGDPAPVVAAWGDGRQKWRIVLDRLDRLESLSRVAGGAIGPVTLIPSRGRVHNLDAALELLESLLDGKNRPIGRVDGLLPLFHWSRLVESHNGDLLDFCEVRPRALDAVPLYHRYQDLVAGLACEEPQLDFEGEHRSWATQFSQRVRKAGFVAGMASALVDDALRLDSLWGVYEGSDASWVFLDSAAVHWSLLSRREKGLQQLHTLLHSRGHRHLSLLTGAIWLRRELEELLATWLQVFGNPYCVGLTDGRPPRLHLADRGLVPASLFNPVEALAGQLAYARARLSGSSDGTILLPGEGLVGKFWSEVAAGRVPLAGKGWAFLSPEEDLVNHLQKGVLLVPALASLESGEVPIASEDTAEAWMRADAQRQAFFDWRRKLCGLEIAGLLAGTWDSVEVMDPRWWRLLRQERDPDQAVAGPRTWTGAAASTMISAPGCTTFDLPGAESGGAKALPTVVLEAVQQWYAALPPDTHRAPKALPATRWSALEKKQTRLLVGNPVPPWASLVGQVAGQWDRGVLDSWLLLVADHMPGAAAEVVAASWTPGLSVFHAEGRNQWPSPVLWARQDDFSNPVFLEYLAIHRPTAIMACGVQDWLPGETEGAQIGAHALRQIVACGAPETILQADRLAKPWRHFLQIACGVEVDEVGPAEGKEGAEPDELAYSGDQESLQRLRALLMRLDSILPLAPEAADSQISPRQLVSVRWLAKLAGISEASLRQGVRVLRWAGRLQGDSLSAAAGQLAGSETQPGTHALLVPRRFAELEHILLRLEGHLPVLFPLLLGTHRPGLSTWIDLAFPPVEIDPDDLLLLDCLFTLGAGGQVPALEYGSERGFMRSTRRLLSCRGAPAEAMEALSEMLRLFRFRVKDVLSGATETAEGFLVETGLGELLADEREFLALGAAMGFWRWLGPRDEGSLYWVDLVTLAESPTVRKDESAWNLLSDLAQNPPEQAPGPPAWHHPVSASGSGSGWGLGGLRHLLPGSGSQENFQQSIQRLEHLLQPGTDPGMLVVEGLAGSGRHEALARALTAIVEPMEVTVFCPDEEAAVVFLESVARAGTTGGMDLRVVARGLIPAAPQKFSGHLSHTPDGVVIICEAQRLEKESRYRIAQLGRGRKLLMTVDQAANQESWESLFLTTPRASDVLRLDRQRRPAKKLWNQWRHLVPEEFRGHGPSLGPGKGTVVADYARNLDQCLARLLQDVESGELPDRLRVVGPLLSDLEFIAEMVRRQGWLAVNEKDLAALLLPGPRELLASATDLLARDSGSTAPLLMPGLLPKSAAGKWFQWHQQWDRNLANMTLDEFFAVVESQDWARSFLAYPQNVGRVAGVLDRWADESVTVLAETALWEAWWLTTLAHLNLPEPAARRPLISLAEASSLAGVFAPGGLYLCLGTEDWRQHYGVLGRVTVQALILFKERSPLAPEPL